MKMADARSYYDSFSRVYDLLSPDVYYRRAREYAIAQLVLQPNQTVLNVPFGTGQNLPYFQNYLANSGQIIGVDLSPGMLAKAQNKIDKNGWENVDLYVEDVGQLSSAWLHERVGDAVIVDAVLCDLGLSGFPDWQQVIEQLMDMLKPGGRFVIMDWYLEEKSARGRFIEWIGGGEVDRPLYQYLESCVERFHVNNSFNFGGVFVAVGSKPDEKQPLK